MYVYILIRPNNLSLLLFNNCLRQWKNVVHLSQNSKINDSKVHI